MDKQLLIKEGMWSQYLEVGIGPYAEIFTKSQPLSSVGLGADAGERIIVRVDGPQHLVTGIQSQQGAVGWWCQGNGVDHSLGAGGGDHR